MDASPRGSPSYQAEPKYDNSLLTNLKASQDQIESLTVLQQVGDFGWLDTPMPNGVYIRVLLAVMFLAFTAFLRLSPRQMVTVGWLFLAQYFLPIVLQAVQFNTNGLVWQGRYTLPLTVMLPVFVMMYAAPRMRAQTDPRLVRAIAWSYPLAVLFLLSAHWRALLVELRRNVSGLNGPSILSGVWQPPLVNSLTLIIVQVALLLVVFLLVLRLYSADYTLLDRPVLGTPSPWRRALELPRRLWRRRNQSRRAEPMSDTAQLEAPAARRLGGRVAAWGPYVAFLLLAVVLVGALTHDFDYVSPTDEISHLDYLQRLPDVPATGDRLSQESMRAWACHGFSPAQPFDFPPCNARHYRADDFPGQGYSYSVPPRRSTTW